jgi:hypothetical protein
LHFPLGYGTGKMPVPQKPVPQEFKWSVGWTSSPPLKSLLQILQLFSLNKLWPISAIDLLSLTLLISLFLNLQDPGTPAAQKPRILAFTALLMRGSEARNNLFAVNATSWTRRELAPNIDVSPTLVWSPNGQRLAFVSGDTHLYSQYKWFNVLLIAVRCALQTYI